MWSTEAKIASRREAPLDANAAVVVVGRLHCDQAEARSRFSRLQGYRQSGPLTNDLSRCAAALETNYLTE
jgi:hypothetical protein